MGPVHREKHQIGGERAATGCTLREERLPSTQQCDHHARKLELGVPCEQAEAKLVMLYRITNNLVDVTTSTLTTAPTRTRCNTHRYLHSPASKPFSFTVVFSTVSPIVYCASFPSVVSCCTKFEDTWSRKFFG